MKLLTFILALAMNVIPQGKAFLEQTTPRDSILIADQLEYGFRLDGVKEGTLFFPIDLAAAANDTIAVVRNWKLDTLNTYPSSHEMDIRASILLAPFEEGEYQLPPLSVIRNQFGVLDTLVFDPCRMDVKTVQVDTATFKIEDGHDIKGLVEYPVTVVEVLTYVAGGALGIGVIVLIVLLVLSLLRKRKKRQEKRDPAHIVALRELEKYRSEKYWAPEKQKAFYSGVTDILKVYIEERFNVDAPEMTTAELFAAIKDEKDITAENYTELKDMFELADFVKFAKHTVPVEDNVKVIPTAVKFVTSTYQAALEEEHKENVL